jgi:hypothetical protein
VTGGTLGERVVRDAFLARAVAVRAKVVGSGFKYL